MLDVQKQTYKKEIQFIMFDLKIKVYKSFRSERLVKHNEL